MVLAGECPVVCTISLADSHAINSVSGNITLGLQSWGGCVVWWAVQGDFHYVTSGFVSPDPTTRDTADAPLCPVSLLEEASGFYDVILPRGNRCHDVDFDCKQSLKRS